MNPNKLFLILIFCFVYCVKRLILLIYMAHMILFLLHEKHRDRLAQLKGNEADAILQPAAASVDRQ